MVSAAQIGGLASEHFAPPGLGAFFWWSSYKHCRPLGTDACTRPFKP